MTNSSTSDSALGPAMLRRSRRLLGNMALACMRPMLRADGRPLPCLLEAGLFAKLDGGDDEELRSRLEAVFTSLGADGGAEATGLHRVRARLAQTTYKYGLLGGSWPPGAGGLSFRIASRLAAGRGMTFDILVLRSGEAIAPHAHEGTVSGMLVVEGEVGFRTYDVTGASGEDALLKPGLAGKYGPGGLSTSSTAYHNLHWIHGFAPVNYIFRFTVTNLGEARAESAARSAARHYCVPGEVLPGGFVRGRWSTEREAKATPFPLAGLAIIDSAA